MNEQFKYDVFLSHSFKDKPAVRELAERLRHDGLRVWYDEWEIKPGDLIHLKIEEGLEQSRTLVLAMSRNAFTSEWMMLERHTVMFRDPTNQRRRFIPLRLDDADIKDTLKQFAYIDWRQKTSEQYERLLTALRFSLVEVAFTTDLKKRSKALPNKILKGHKAIVSGIALIPDGKLAVSSSYDGTARVWDLDSGKCLNVLEGHTDYIRGVVITTNGLIAVTGSDDQTVRIWNLREGRCVAVLGGGSLRSLGVAVTPDGWRAISAHQDWSVRIWDLDSERCIGTIDTAAGAVQAVAITSDGYRAVSASEYGGVLVWDLHSRQRIGHLDGHSDHVRGIAITADGQFVITGSDDQTVRVWDLTTGKCVSTLEGHTASVSCVATTPNGQFAVTGSHDRTIRVWELKSGQCLCVIRGHMGYVNGVGLTTDGKRIVSASDDHTVRVWELPDDYSWIGEESETTRYTNAKVLLVGDSGVGKSGLAYRLIEDRFVSTISTDGAWATQLKLPHDTNTDDSEKEIWLWDFAGQSDYRLIHQLFMDETALAVLVFNPQSENPFEGLGDWDRNLQRAARRPFNKLLVAGRCDRGGLTISNKNIGRFAIQRGFTDYLETSAVTGEGCQALRDAIINHIDWENIPWRSSPRLFKLLKDAIVQFKDKGRVLLRIAELKQQLEMHLPNESFTLDELRTIVGLLAGPGIVWKLEFGDFVLLQPERVNAYAAAVIRTVRAHTDEIGCIAEERVLAGDIKYEDMKRLLRDEEQIVLRAMHQTFVDHGLCLREHTEAGTLLVFPSYFKRERPELTDHPAAFVTYRFSGMLEDIYATLVVRLHHTTTFEKDQLWRFAADFKTLTGKRFGLKMTRKPEGEAELTVYCEPDIQVETKATFIRYVHEHLRAKDPEVKRERHYVCEHCQSCIEDRQAVQKRLSRGLKDILCVNCESRVPLWDLIEEKFASEETQRQVREMDKQARKRIDNESRELILVGHAFAIAGEAGQIFRPTPNSDWGIDGEIEFKDNNGNASGNRAYLQLKSGDSYLESRKDGREIFKIKNARHAEYWQSHEYPVMLVIRTSDGVIRWMNVTEYLKKQEGAVKQVVFEGEPFTAQSVWRMRDKVLSP